ncbi:uncharacterized protein BJ171DRAFT_505929 [Polychytrium aggregatum]|uniref:uncharacterized protein n=1 Tax=Polychytrium aggregatum TaxID=110093 RepID=UPI0022FE188C|nr:uncharacterized protein BJ171DRAFT_505929 [Polychytrium aggregatum]KAI9204484.1 hypothetical protein BJ171DRAFT_505929 [Polychytrium aggregatum]
MQNQQPHIVADFQIEHEIGRGSFATVYLAHHVSKTSHIVAIKAVLREKLNRKLAENLETEIKILKGICHPNIVSLLDVVKTAKHIHLLMEYCSMGDLSTYIKKKGLVADPSRPQVLESLVKYNYMLSPAGGLCEVAVRHFLLQLASALEFLRSQSLIHRDLKPQNLLLTPAAAQATNIELPSPLNPATVISVPPLPTLKLADFGFARPLLQQSLASTLCGSPLYMAPEILRGDRYDAKADLWSLGAVLYEMIAGRPPFKAQNHVELLNKIDRGEGTIKFPGEEGWIQSGRGTPPSVTKRASVSALSSAASSPNRVGPNDPALRISGSAPIHVAEDLKDLVRRLLKRNPVERISFEEFFIHPAVIAFKVEESTSVYQSFVDQAHSSMFRTDRSASDSSSDGTHPYPNPNLAPQTPKRQPFHSGGPLPDAYTPGGIIGPISGTTIQPYQMLPPKTGPAQAIDSPSSDPHRSSTGTGYPPGPSFAQPVSSHSPVPKVASFDRMHDPRISGDGSSNLGPILESNGTFTGGPKSRIASQPDLADDARGVSQRPAVFQPQAATAAPGSPAGPIMGFRPIPSPAPFEDQLPFSSHHFGYAHDAAKAGQRFAEPPFPGYVSPEPRPTPPEQRRFSPESRPTLSSTPPEARSDPLRTPPSERARSGTMTPTMPTTPTPRSDGWLSKQPVSLPHINTSTPSTPTPSRRNTPPSSAGELRARLGQPQVTSDEDAQFSISSLGSFEISEDEFETSQSDSTANRHSHPTTPTRLFPPKSGGPNLPSGAAPPATLSDAVGVASAATKLSTGNRMVIIGAKKPSHTKSVKSPLASPSTAYPSDRSSTPDKPELDSLSASLDDYVVIDNDQEIQVNWIDTADKNDQPEPAAVVPEHVAPPVHPEGGLLRHRSLERVVAEFASMPKTQTSTAAVSGGPAIGNIIPTSITSVSTSYSRAGSFAGFPQEANIGPIYQPLSNKSTPVSSLLVDTHIKKLEHHYSLLFSALFVSSWRAYAVHSYANEMFESLRQLLQSHASTRGASGVAAMAQTSEQPVLGMSKVAIEHQVRAHEALSLYLLALELYQTSIEFTRLIFESEQRRQQETTQSSTTVNVPIGVTQTSQESAKWVQLGHLSEAVEWLRAMFNQCLDRAEVVREVSMESIDVNIEMISRGVEKIIYEHALEVAKQSATLELESQSLPQYRLALSGYQTAILLIESLLIMARPQAKLFTSEGTEGGTGTDRLEGVANKQTDNAGHNPASSAEGQSQRLDHTGRTPTNAPGTESLTSSAVVALTPDDCRDLERVILKMELRLKSCEIKVMDMSETRKSG